MVSTKTRVMIGKAFLSITDLLAFLFLIWAALYYVRLGRGYRAGRVREEDLRRSRRIYGACLTVFLVLLFAILLIR